MVFSDHSPMFATTSPRAVPAVQCVDWRVCIAPMMDWTDRHCRYFHRLLSPHARLYTEMVTSAALVRGRQLRLLEHSQQEHPVALQLGGSDPQRAGAGGAFRRAGGL